MPTSAPTADATRIARCEEAASDLLNAEAEALTAAAAVERYLTSPAARGVAAVPEGLPEPELDGRHVNRYQALAQTAGLTEMLLDEEGWAAVTGWQQAWAVAESFGDNPELWDTAAEAAIEVSMVTVERLPDPPVGIEPRILVSAVGVARWRAARLRALTATSPAAMLHTHADALDAASRAFTFATLGSGREGITEDQFTDPLERALRTRLTATRKFISLDC